MPLSQSQSNSLALNYAHKSARATAIIEKTRSFLNDQIQNDRIQNTHCVRCQTLDAGQGCAKASMHLVRLDAVPFEE
jgi:hypothetical protein